MDQQIFIHPCGIRVCHRSDVFWGVTPYSVIESEDLVATVIRVVDWGRWSSEMFVNFYKSTRLHVSEDDNLQGSLLFLWPCQKVMACISIKSATTSSCSWASWHYVPQIFLWSGEMDHLPLFFLLWLNLQAQQNNYCQWNMHVLGIEQLFVYIFAKNAWSDCKKRRYCPSEGPQITPLRSTQCLSNEFENAHIQIYILKISHTQHIRQAIYFSC